jgi:hypothetical protein
VFAETLRLALKPQGMQFLLESINPGQLQVKDEELKTSFLTLQTQTESFTIVALSPHVRQVMLVPYPGHEQRLLSGSNTSF